MRPADGHDPQAVRSPTGDHPHIRHVDLSTTEIYARASTEATRKALEAAYPDISSDDLPEWNQDPGLLDWLTSL